MWIRRRAAIFWLLVTPFAFAQVDVGPAHPGIPSLASILNDLDNGQLDLDDLRRMGLSVFSTPFNTFDGLGDGPFHPSETETAAFGQRPTLQGNGLFLRLNGLDAQSCNECHTIVSNRTRPPTLGFAGVGGIVQNAIIMPTVIDVADSMDNRVVFQPGHNPDLPLVFDGVADYNGRFANPPFLFGGGGVELLGKEMTHRLQKLLDLAQSSPAGTTIALNTHGVHFGSITSLGGGDVQLDVEGIGPEDISGVSPEEVLVVRPFGRKGENFTMRDFDRGAMQFHFGVQPVEVVDPDEIGGVDDDGDGVTEEVTVAEMSMLHVFDVTNPRPEIIPFSNKAFAGFRKFKQIGCADCHIPEIKTKSRFIPLAHPEVAHDPTANVYLELDLEDVGFDSVFNYHATAFDLGGDEKEEAESESRFAFRGVRVPLFADLKRHDMGPRLAETFERGEIPNQDFTTARLWGVADTAPYLHDGRATTLTQAIEFHGGEAQAARDAFMALSANNQTKILHFLRSLRTPTDANESLLPLD